jgi:hypothetical protein
MVFKSSDICKSSPLSMISLFCLEAQAGTLFWLEKQRTVRHRFVNITSDEHVTLMFIAALPKLFGRQIIRDPATKEECNQVQA